MKTRQDNAHKGEKSGEILASPLLTNELAWRHETVLLIIRDPGFDLLTAELAWPRRLPCASQPAPGHQPRCGVAARRAGRYSAHMAVLMTGHVQLDERGVAWIDDTNTKVIEVALDMIAHGWSPEEIHFQHPHLSLAQIHAALGYYYDHQPELDAQIQRGLRELQRLRKEAGESPVQKRLREMGKLT